MSYFRPQQAGKIGPRTVYSLLNSTSRLSQNAGQVKLLGFNFAAVSKCGAGQPCRVCLIRVSQVKGSVQLTRLTRPSQIRFSELAPAAALIAGIPKNRILDCRNCQIEVLTTPERDVSEDRSVSSRGLTEVLGYDLYDRQNACHGFSRLGQHEAGNHLFPAFRCI